MEQKMNRLLPTEGFSVAETMPAATAQAANRKTLPRTLEKNGFLMVSQLSDSTISPSHYRTALAGVNGNEGSVICITFLKYNSCLYR
jgi:hypothetical protein